MESFLQLIIHNLAFAAFAALLAFSLAAFAAFLAACDVLKASTLAVIAASISAVITPGTNAKAKVFVAPLIILTDLMPVI